MKSNLGERLIKAIPYIIINILAYLVLPYAAAYIESYTASAMGTLQTVAPLMSCAVSIAVGYFYGKEAGRDPLMPVICGILVLVGYGKTAWLYVPIAALFSFIGQCFGWLYRKR